MNPDALSTRASLSNRSLYTGSTGASTAAAASTGSIRRRASAAVATLSGILGSSIQRCSLADELCRQAMTLSEAEGLLPQQRTNMLEALIHIAEKETDVENKRRLYGVILSETLKRLQMYVSGAHSGLISSPTALLQAILDDTQASAITELASI